MGVMEHWCASSSRRFWFYWSETKIVNIVSAANQSTRSLTLGPLRKRQYLFWRTSIWCLRSSCQVSKKKRGQSYNHLRHVNVYLADISWKIPATCLSISQMSFKAFYSSELKKDAIPVRSCKASRPPGGVFFHLSHHWVMNLPICWRQVLWLIVILKMCLGDTRMFPLSQ